MRVHIEEVNQFLLSCILRRIHAKHYRMGDKFDVMADEAAASTRAYQNKPQNGKARIRWAMFPEHINAYRMQTSECMQVISLAISVQRCVHWHLIAVQFCE